jgi:hypothetical protein
MTGAQLHSANAPEVSGPVLIDRAAADRPDVTGQVMTSDQLTAVSAICDPQLGPTDRAVDTSDSKVVDLVQALARQAARQHFHNERRRLAEFDQSVTRAAA